ncbi:MAG: alginate export family protein [Pseudomonadota bacterium]
MKAKLTSINLIISRAFLACLACLIVAQPALAEEEDCPPLPLIPYELDPRLLRDAECDPGPLSDLKYIPLTPDERIVLSFGGEARARYEITTNPGFGAGEEDGDGAFLHRYALSADLQVGRNLRFYGEIASAFAEGQLEGPGPIDENQLDFQNLFVELRDDLGPGVETYARIGRQELNIGSGRLVSIRDGPNVRRTFDGVRLGVLGENWDVDAFGFGVRGEEPGVFDDRVFQDEFLWGVYATRHDAPFLPGSADFFYLGYDEDSAVFDQGTADETRHTLGTRFYGSEGPWDWNWEAMVQFGSFGQGDILAWTVATDTGYTFVDTPWRPRIAFNANIASGDDDPNDADLQTFNPLFPRGNYFSEAAILGPRNFFNAHLFLTVHPTEKLTVTADVNNFFRLNRNDGVYAPSGLLIAPGDGSDERYVGSSLSVNAEYEISRNLLLTGIYTHFEPGDVLKDTSPGKAVDFFELTLRFRF